MGFIPVLTVLPAAKLELWHFTLGEDLTPWLAVFPLYVLLPLFCLFCSFPPKPALCREKFHNLVIPVKAMIRAAFVSELWCFSFCKGFLLVQKVV